MENKILELCKDIVNKKRLLGCNGIACEKCPFGNENSCYACEGYRNDKGMEIALQYIKEHTPQEIKFNWEDFKEGKIAIHTPTLESFANFNKMCRKVLDDGLPTDFWDVYRKTTCVDFSKISNELTYGNIKWFKENGITIVTFEDFICKEKNNMNIEKTFRELIIGWCNVIPDDVFKLQRKEYTFEEAFKAYEEGKEIESCYSGVKYLIQHGGSDCYSDGRKTNLIEFNEIRGKWYINN